jgi:hypothetical protein
MWKTSTYRPLVEETEGKNVQQVKNMGKTSTYRMLVEKTEGKKFSK